LGVGAAEGEAEAAEVEEGEVSPWSSLSPSLSLSLSSKMLVAAGEEAIG
jgi:hypothetical protein